MVASNLYMCACTKDSIIIYNLIVLFRSLGMNLNVKLNVIFTMRLVQKAVCFKANYFKAHCTSVILTSHET